MENEFVLISVKFKDSQSQGQIYVVRRKDISSFIEAKLSSDNVLLVDSIDTFAVSSEQ